jgi:hypothetical protein
MSYPHFPPDCYEHHGLVRDFKGPRPTIVCLCGSTRFMREFRDANLKLTLEGHIVLTVGCDTKSDDMLDLTKEDKARLDELHKRKIELADWVHVLNVHGYVGLSTRGEVEHALKLGKRISWLSQFWGRSLVGDVTAFWEEHGRLPEFV